MIKDGVTQYIVVKIPDLCGGGGGGGDFAVKNDFAVYGVHEELGFNFQSSEGGVWKPNLFGGGWGISIPENFDNKFVTGKVILRLYTNWSGEFDTNNYVETTFHISNIVDNKLILPNLDFSGGGTSIQGSSWHWPETSGQFVQVWMQGTFQSNAIDFTNPDTVQFTIFTNRGFVVRGWELRIEYLETVPV